MPMPKLPPEERKRRLKLRTKQAIERRKKTESHIRLLKEQHSKLNDFRKKKRMTWYELGDYLIKLLDNN
jgi:hypothetical protein